MRVIIVSRSSPVRPVLRGVLAGSSRLGPKHETYYFIIRIIQTNKRHDDEIHYCYLKLSLHGTVTYAMSMHLAGSTKKSPSDVEAESI